TDGETEVPLEVRTVALVQAAFRVFQRDFAEVTELQTALRSLREDAVRGVRPPGNDPDRGLLGGSVAASVDNVLRGVRFRRVEGGVPRGEAQEPLRVRHGVAVED